MKKRSLEPVLRWEGETLYCGTIVLASLERDGKEYRLAKTAFQNDLAEIMRTANQNDERYLDIKPVVERWYSAILSQLQFSNE